MVFSGYTTVYGNVSVSIRKENGVILINGAVPE